MHVWLVTHAVALVACSFVLRLRALQEIAARLMAEFASKPYAQLSDELLRRLHEMKSSYLKSKPFEEYMVHIVNFMRDITEDRCAQCSSDNSHLMVGYIGASYQNADFGPERPPALVSHMWDLTKFYALFI